jgi:hypothetical protein
VAGVHAVTKGAAAMGAEDPTWRLRRPLRQEGRPSQVTHLAELAALSRPRAAVLPSAHGSPNQPFRKETSID